MYVHESGSSLITKVLDALVVSALCRVEVSAALYRKATDSKRLTQAIALEKEFLVDLLGTETKLPRFEAVSLEEPILNEAAECAKRYGLKSLDAIQLSSALAVRDHDLACQTFFCFDQQLARAALVEGFEVIP